MNRRGAASPLRIAIAITLAIGAAACSSIYDYRPPSAQTQTQTRAGTAAQASYVVRRGDTLYSIAWQHGLDPNALAAWNNLANPDRIYVGQRLVLRPSGAPAASRGTVAGTSPSGTTSPSGSAQRPTAGGPARTAPSPQAARPAAGAGPLWQWPVRGTVVSRFGGDGGLATGIGIAGRIGQDVLAAADGRVAYVGRNLVEYGQLIIIAHNESWLSAYGYNQGLFVSEGDVVRRGQKIAEVGPGPGREPRLHFEIRRLGEPVDPLALLPEAG